MSSNNRPMNASPVGVAKLSTSELDADEIFAQQAHCEAFALAVCGLTTVQEFLDTAQQIEEKLSEARGARAAALTEGATIALASACATRRAGERRGRRHRVITVALGRRSTLRS